MVSFQHFFLWGPLDSFDSPFQTPQVGLLQWEGFLIHPSGQESFIECLLGTNVLGLGVKVLSEKSPVSYNNSQLGHKAERPG